MNKVAYLSRFLSFNIIGKEYHTISTGFCGVKLRNSSFKLNFFGKSGKIFIVETKMASNGAKHNSSFAGHVKTIGTHDGKFHCDEVLACSMLKLLPEYKDAEIIRLVERHYYYC